jgi:predicted anti-sigma-YlaC factor YlaD
LLTCREVSERANKYVDGELGFWSALQVRMHLIGCRYCRAFVRQLRTVIKLVREHGYTLPEDEVGGDLLEALRRRRVPPK